MGLKRQLLFRNAFVHFQLTLRHVSYISLLWSICQILEPIKGNQPTPDLNPLHFNALKMVGIMTKTHVYESIVRDLNDLIAKDNIPSPITKTLCQISAATHTPLHSGVTDEVKYSESLSTG